ncbi:unnamed protein product [Auanema sp. JU1783]|nr:unnamed protein product [Auanema sp. JU1783]
MRSPCRVIQSFIGAGEGQKDVKANVANWAIVYEKSAVLSSTTSSIGVTSIIVTKTVLLYNCMFRFIIRLSSFMTSS